MYSIQFSKDTDLKDKITSKPTLDYFVNFNQEDTKEFIKETIDKYKKYTELLDIVQKTKCLTEHLC